MAISFDAATSYPNTGGSITPHTYSHTCGTGANGTVLFVGIFHLVDSTDIVTAVTFDGVAMTRVSTIAASGAGGRGYLYMLVSPATGTKTVSISLSGARGIFSGAVSYFGMHSVVDASNTGSSAASTDFTVNTTTVSSVTWVLSAFFDISGRALVAGTNTTERMNNTGGGGLFMGDTNADQTPAGTYGQNVTLVSGEVAGCTASMSRYASSGQGAIILFS